MYSAVVGWSVLYTLINSANQIVLLFKYSMSLLLFCLVVLAVAEKVMLNAPIIIVGFSIYAFSFISFNSCILRFSP